MTCCVSLNTHLLMRCQIRCEVLTCNYKTKPAGEEKTGDLKKSKTNCQTREVTIEKNTK